jgi:hypothetical protein
VGKTPKHPLMRSGGGGFKAKLDTSEKVKKKKG